jgi:hypothetical protein
MNTILSGLMATVFATSFAVASVVPAVAVPSYSPKAPPAETGLSNKSNMMGTGSSAV